MLIAKAALTAHLLLSSWWSPTTLLGRPPETLCPCRAHCLCMCSALLHGNGCCWCAPAQPLFKDVSLSLCALRSCAAITVASTRLDPALRTSRLAVLRPPHILMLTQLQAALRPSFRLIPHWAGSAFSKDLHAQVVMRALHVSMKRRMGCGVASWRLPCREPG